MKFLYDEHSDSWAIRFPLEELILPHRNVPMLVGWAIVVDVISVRIALRPVVIPGL